LSTKGRPRVGYVTVAILADVKVVPKKRREGARAVTIMANAGRLERRVVVSVFGRCVKPRETTVLFAVLVTELIAVMGPDQVTKILQQLDGGKSLLGCPIGGNREGDCQKQSGGGRAHNLVFPAARLDQPWRRRDGGFGCLIEAVLDWSGEWSDTGGTDGGGSGLRNDGPLIRMVMQ